MTEPASLLPMARYRQSKGWEGREEGRGGGGEGGRREGWVREERREEGREGVSVGGEREGDS